MSEDVCNVMPVAEPCVAAPIIRPYTVITTALTAGRDAVEVKRRDVAEVAAAAKDSAGRLQAVTVGATPGAKNAAGKLSVMVPPALTTVWVVNANVAVALALPGARSASDTLNATAKTEDSAGRSHTSSTCALRPVTSTGRVHRGTNGVGLHATVNSLSTLLPQQNNVPSLWRAHVCWRPAAMATTPLSTVVQLQEEQEHEADVTHTF